MSIVKTERVDLIITDMGCGEDPTAGLDLLRWLRGSGCKRPTAGFTSLRSVAEHAHAVGELGALECTAGTVQLLRFLAEHIR